MLTKTQVLGALPIAPGMGQRMNAQMRACAAWASLEEHDKILDMSCGEGALLANLSGRYRLTICGMCDTPEQARAVRERLEDADVISARLEDIPWRDNTFDAVLLPTPLRKEARRALEEALRVLRMGGQMVLAAPLWHMRGDGEPRRRELMRLMQETGFEEVSFRAAGFSGVIVGWKRGRLPKSAAV